MSRSAFRTGEVGDVSIRLTCPTCGTAMVVAPATFMDAMVRCPICPHDLHLPSDYAIAVAALGNGLRDVVRAQKRDSDMTVTLEFDVSLQNELE